MHKLIGLAVALAACCSVSASGQEAQLKVSSDAPWPKVTSLYDKYAYFPLREEKVRCVEELKVQMKDITGPYDPSILLPVDQELREHNCLDDWSLLDQSLAPHEANSPPSTDVTVKETDDSLYIRLYSFADGTKQNLDAAFSALKSGWTRRIKRVVLDMRGNRGGTLETLRDILDAYFSPAPKREFMRIDKAQDDKDWLPLQTTTRVGRLHGLPIRILADHDCMSACEWAIAILRYEWFTKSVVFLGSKTWGKAVIQCMRPDGPFSIKVTCGEWRIGDQRIHGVGIESDRAILLDHCRDDVSCIVKQAVRG